MRIDLSMCDRQPITGRSDYLVAVKSYELARIRQRYTASPGGSRDRRPSVLGGLYHLVVRNGQADFRYIAGIMECRGVDVRGDLVAVGSEDRVYVAGPDSIKTLTDPWSSYLHTVRFSPDGSAVLTASAGWDTVIEYDLDTGHRCREWLAWEHGFSTGENADGQPTLLTRSANLAAMYAGNQRRVQYYPDPCREKIPTRCRAAAISSAEYADNGGLILTLFRQQQVIHVSPDFAGWTVKVSGLAVPHNGRQIDGDFWVADTGSGRVRGVGPELALEYDFSGLPSLWTSEWVQSYTWDKGLLVVIDSNRRKIWRYDTENEILDSIGLPEAWAAQEIIPCPLSVFPALDTMAKELR